MFTTTPLSAGRVGGGALGAGTKTPGGRAAAPPAEDDLHVLRAADVEVVADQRLEEGPGTAGSVEDDGAGDLDLAHGQFPPVAVVLVGMPEGHGQAVQPSLGEHLDGARLEPVADGLQRGRVVAGGEPVG